MFTTRSMKLLRNTDGSVKGQEVGGGYTIDGIKNRAFGLAGHNNIFQAELIFITKRDNNLFFFPTINKQIYVINSDSPICPNGNNS